jgi:hypothetical protein
MEVGPERGLECLVDCLLPISIGQLLDDAVAVEVDANVSLLIDDRSVAGEMGDAGREE